MTRPFRISRARFEALVEEAWSEVPDVFRRRLDHVVVRTLPEPGPDQPRDLLGLYEGWPEPVHPGAGVDVITIFQRPLEEECSSLDELRAEVRETLLHEIGHHFGLPEAEVEAAGYEPHELEAAEAEVADGWTGQEARALGALLVFPPLGFVLAAGVPVWSRLDLWVAGLAAAGAVVAGAVLWSPACLLALVVPGPSLLAGLPAAAYLWMRAQDSGPERSGR